MGVSKVEDYPQTKLVDSSHTTRDPNKSRWFYSDNFLGVRLIHPSVIFIGFTATSGGCGLRIGRVAFCTIPGIKITIGCATTKPLAGGIRCSGTWPHGSGWLPEHLLAYSTVCLVCLSTYKILQAMPMTLWHLITVFFVNHGFVAWPYQIWLLHVSHSLSLWCLPYLASKSLELCQLCLTKNQLSEISSKRPMPTHPANLNVGKQAQYQHKTTDDCEHLCQKNKRFSCPFKLPSKETL